MKKRGQETTRTSTIVDEYIRQLSDSGISLEGLKLLGDFEFPEEDRKLTEKELIEKVLEDENYAEQKKTIEKYITAFIKADLITQEIHRRRGFELVDKSNDKWIDGGVYLFRTKQKGAISTNLEIGSDETVKTVNGTDYVQMQYVKPEEFDELVNKKSKKLRYRYTINEDTGEIKIAQIKTTEIKETNQSNAINSLFTAKSTDIEVEDIISIAYKSYIEKYTMPYEFLVNLCEVTQNPEFVYHVAQLALETNIMLVVQDDTTVEHITTVEEEKYESYENTGSSSTSGASKTSEETKIMKYETIITTLVPHLQVEYANTWSFFENYEFSKTETTEPVTTGKKVESNSIPGTLPNYHPGGLQNVESPYGGYETISTIEKWTGTFLVQKTINTETKVTVTEYNPGILKNSIEKSKQFLGLLRNSTGTCAYDCTSDEKNAEKCAENAVFVRAGINVEYGIPNSTRTEPPLNNLKSGEKMLYTLMGESLTGKENTNAEEDNASLYKTKMTGLIDHMKYLMTLPDNEEINLEDFKDTDSESGKDTIDIDNIEGLQIKYENIDEESLEILYKICQAEAGGSSEVEIGHVASVILNRVICSSWPNTVKEVVFQKSQFSPVSSGSYYKMVPTEKTKRAVNSVLTSGDTTGGAVYFRTKESAISAGMPTSKNETHPSYIYLFTDPNTHVFHTNSKSLTELKAQSGGQNDGQTGKQEIGKDDTVHTKPATGKLSDIFKNGIPTTKEEIQKYLATVSVPITTKNGQKTTKKVTVNKEIADDLISVLQKAQDAGFKVYDVQGFSWRAISGTSKMSQHSLGLAVDINVNENYCVYPSGKVDAGAFWKPGENEYSIPSNGVLVKSFKAIGWGWGGDWNSKKDYMHFSYTGG